MSRAEHSYTLDDVTVLLVVPDGVMAPRWVEVQRDGRVLRLRHAGVRNLRAPVKRKPRQESPLVKIPPDFAPPVDEVERARGAAPSVNLEFETAQMVDWFISKGEARADWLATWRGWIRRTHKENLAKGWKPTHVMVRDETPQEEWCRKRGITVEEYERRKGDKDWLERIKRQGVVQ